MEILGFSLGYIPIPCRDNNGEDIVHIIEAVMCLNPLDLGSSAVAGI
jgi:hypothetical protein